MTYPDYISETAGGDLSIDLCKGVTVAGARVMCLTMREPTVRDQEIAGKMKGDPAAQEVALFANLCTVEPEAIRSMTMRDYTRLQNAYRCFLD